LQVGEWLGNHDELAVATMRAYIDAEHFGGMPIDAALRQLLSRFRLPGRVSPTQP
jgi:Sec7-like guanine-nucleotide exchange factor